VVTNGHLKKKLLKWITDDLLVPKNYEVSYLLYRIYFFHICRFYEALSGHTDRQSAMFNMARQWEATESEQECWRTDLKVQDDGPDETQCQFRVAVDNLISANVHETNLPPSIVHFSSLATFRNYYYYYYYYYY